MAELLDLQSYDLDTVAGQRKAIQDIVDFQNRQYDRSQGQQSFQIVAYQQLNITLIDGSPSGVYTTPYVHGLGFAPVVIPFIKQDDGLGGNLYSALPYNEKRGGIFNPDPRTNTYQYYTTDDNKLYYNVRAINIGGFFTTLQFSAAFYIFNIPAQV